MPLSSKQAEKSTRLFHATAVHGSERTFRYPFSTLLANWLQGQNAPWLSALVIIGGGLAMAVASLMAPSLGVLGSSNFAAFPRGLWAQIIAFTVMLISALW
jgi:hypothetical protein